MKQITAVFLAILAPILLASEGMTEEMESDSSPIFSQSDIQPSGTILLTPQSDNQPSSYILGHGDRVVVDIFGLPDYSQEYGVLADGTLNLPLVGSIYVQGLTLTQASQEIEERYQAFVRRPVVTLDVQRPRPLQIAVVGEVNRPGTYSFATVERAAQGDRDQRINVTAAISQAGGITQLADVRNVQVYRPEPYRGGEWRVHKC
jgi:polysaccharide export outer membrane protein